MSLVLGLEARTSWGHPGRCPVPPASRRRRATTPLLQPVEPRARLDGKGFSGPPPVPAASGANSGSVYVDKNGNGIRDASEQGIAGVTVGLTRVKGPHTFPVLTTETTNGMSVIDASGSYSFTGLRPGHYTISTLPGGGGLGTITGIDVRPHHSIEHADLGGPPEVSGTIYEETSSGIAPFADAPVRN